jgi:hypothetical protein
MNYRGDTVYTQIGPLVWYVRVLHCSRRSSDVDETPNGCGHDDVRESPYCILFELVVCH